MAVPQIDELVARESDREQGYVNAQIADFFGDHVNHLAGLAGKSPLFVEHVLCHPRYMAACDHFLLPNCSDYQLNIAHMMERGPGCDAQFIHRDAWVWKRMPPAAGEIQLASLIALTDFTPENGGTLIVPGSHLWDDERYPEPGATHFRLEPHEAILGLLQLQGDVLAALRGCGRRILGRGRGLLLALAGFGLLVGVHRSGRLGHTAPWLEVAVTKFALVVFGLFGRFLHRF